jgi:VanZ family protein
VIFTASTDLGSTRHTSRLIGPFLRWFKPDVSAETIHAVQVMVRKTGHVTEYAILAVLFWIARRVAGGTRPLLQNWNWREAWLIVLGCALYAITDELHQSFVATRQESVVDIFIDTVGALFGLLAIRAFGRWRKRW